MKRMSAFYVLYVALALVGCANLQPQSYDERIASAYAAVAITNDATTTLVLGETISKPDGRAVLEQTRRARGLLDQGDLQSALGILKAAQDLLCNERPTDPNCIALRARSTP